ncbi:MAG: carboxypeptidase-like regulatory domain-containing protein, partial [Saprospiraceae bacterium]
MKSTISILCLLLFSVLLTAQIPVGGVPPALQPDRAPFFTDKPLSRQELPALDLQRILEEDAKGPDVRFAAPIPVDYSLATSGQWTELPNGDRVWRVSLYSRGARALITFYRDLYLPSGAELFMYAPDGTQVLGPYTATDNPDDGRFMTGLLYGEAAVIEYFEPASVRGQGHFRIDRVDHAYKPVAQSERSGGRSPALGFGASLECHIGADCPEADPVADLKRSVCRIIIVVEEGTGYCTGNLLNNTAEDGKPYIYTGFHCMDGYTPIYSLWRFDFNYRVTGCDPAVSEPQFNSITGSTFRAGRQANDFLLLELDKPIPVNFAPYYMGWNRQATPPDTSYMLHHPRGDVQKFSRSTEQATLQDGPIRWDSGVITPRNHHFDVDFTEGNYEIGSSGAALINKKRQMIGSLNGGNPDTMGCDFSQAWFGRLDLAWEGGGTSDTRLKDWLDPIGSDTIELGGYAESQATTVSGIIRTYFDKDPVAGVEVSLSLDGNSTTVTSATDGTFTFTNVAVANT